MESINKGYRIKNFAERLQLLLFLSLKKLFQALDYIIPKDEKAVLFASKSGKTPNANVYLPWRKLKDCGDYKAYLVAKERVDHNHLNIYSPFGLWIVLRAKHVFLTHGPNDVYYAHYSMKKNVVYVGHGVPLKAFVFTNHHMSLKEQLKHKLEVPTFDSIVASSLIDRSRLVHCFDCEEDRVIVTGLPRNDLLFENTTNLKSKFPNKRLVLYAPTYRDYQKFEFFPFEDFDVEEFDRFLGERNIHVFLRSHINDRTRKKIAELTSISELSFEQHPEVQELLNEIDCVITDYSSIYIDFLLLNRKIIFIPYDIDLYREKRGIMYPYEQVTPGRHVSTIEEFKKALVEEDQFEEERIRLKNYFHDYEAGNTERLLNQVLGTSFE